MEEYMKTHNWEMIPNLLGDVVSWRHILTGKIITHAEAVREWEAGRVPIPF